MESIEIIENDRNKASENMEVYMQKYIEIKKIRNNNFNKTEEMTDILTKTVNKEYQNEINEKINELEETLNELKNQLDNHMHDYIQNKNLNNIFLEIMEILANKLDGNVNQKKISDTLNNINNKVIFPLLEELYEEFGTDSTEILYDKINAIVCGEKKCIEILNLIKDDEDVIKLINDNDVKNSKLKKTMTNLLIKINEILNFNKTKSGGNKNNFIDKLLKIKY